MFTRSRAAIAAIVIAVACAATGVAQAAPVAKKEVTAPSAPAAPGAVAGADAAGVAASTQTTARFAGIRKSITRYVARHGTRYSFASYIDAATGRIVVETNAPARVTSKLTAAPTPPAAGKAAAPVRIRHAATRALFHRRDDIPSFWGGAGIVSGGGGTCSSGYAVRNAAGTVSMMTAGHCFALGAPVVTESRLNFYGTVTSRSLTGGGGDSELVGGRPYSGRIYTGGVVSQTSAPVRGTGIPVPLFGNYCHSGRTTGENCGHVVVSNAAVVCTSFGCNFPEIAFGNGVQPTFGDSGSPFYARDGAGGVVIQGHVIAGNGSTSFAEPWYKVAPAFGVAIVTG